jgi:ATP-binding cassette subfamily B protein
VLVLRQGELIDQGTHDELLTRCDTYRRIFAHYGAAQIATPAEPAQIALSEPVRAREAR